MRFKVKYTTTKNCLLDFYCWYWPIEPVVAIGFPDCSLQRTQLNVAFHNHGRKIASAALDNLANVTASKSRCPHIGARTVVHDQFSRRARSPDGMCCDNDGLGPTAFRIIGIDPAVHPGRRLFATINSFEVVELCSDEVSRLSPVHESYLSCHRSSARPFVVMWIYLVVGLGLFPLLWPVFLLGTENFRWLIFPFLHRNPNVSCVENDYWDLLQRRFDWLYLD